MVIGILGPAVIAEESENSPSTETVEIPPTDISTTITRDEQNRQIKIETARLEMELAESLMKKKSDELKNLRSMMVEENNIVTVSEVNKAEEEYENAVSQFKKSKLNLQQVELDSLKDAWHLTVKSTRLYESRDGREMFSITLRNSSLPVRLVESSKVLGREIVISAQISARYADAVICNSQCTANDLIKYYGRIPEDKVAVAYSAAAPQYCPMDDVDLAAIQKQYGLDHPYILYVGTIEMRKNIRLMLEAFALIKKNKGIPHQMLLVGKVREHFDLLKVITELNLSQDVIVAGYVPDEDLPLLYNGADLFIYISLYEGFGLPPLEAMHCGTPVVTSNVSSLPEVVGDAAVMVDPYNVNEIADGIYKLLTDKKLRNK